MNTLPKFSLSIGAICLAGGLFFGCGSGISSTPAMIDSALANGELAREAFTRSQHYVDGWLTKADPTTGLIPRNLKDNYWNAQDAAADNYPFMVLTSYFTSDSLYRGRMIDMLNMEIAKTSALGACPATYDFATQAFRDKTIDTSNVTFGSAEYMKDGLLPITEWLGKTPWSDRMISILNDLHKLVDVVTVIKGNYFGNSQVIEVNGDLLQVLSRMYWMTGNREYLDWAIRIGDHYLLGDNNPADLERLRLRDHGCEVLLGLCELYATVNFAEPEKKAQYQKPLHRMLDRILEVGRNEHGLFYDEVNPKTGEILESRLADTWGYTLDGYYIVYEIDGKKEYRDAIVKVFGNLNPYYRNHDWEGNMDGYADAIESALNLYNREPSMTEAANWINSEIRVMYGFQKESGIIEGWHGDGNFARTSIMYALWKTQGTHISPWRQDVVYGAVANGNGVTIAMKSAQPWSGKLIFDYPRYKENLNLPMDWTRINQFPQWYTTFKDRQYSVKTSGKSTVYTGEQLQQGVDIQLTPNETVVIDVIEK